MAPAVSPSLVGREEELERVFAFLAGIAEGAATLLLEGEAGIGKSTVWEAAVASAQESGYRVLEARPAEAERELSFAALADLLRDFHDEIGYLPEPQRRALRVALVLEEAEGDPPEQRAVAAALLGLLRRLAGDLPVVVAIDDAQWLDPPSAGALAYAIRRLDREPVRVLATQRTGKSALALREADRVRIGPLPLADLDRILRLRLGTRFLRPTLRQLEDASGGNPFYALEIAASLLRSGQRAEPGEPLPIPSSLLDVLRDRLATLSPAAHDAALVTAALARPTVDTVRDAGGRADAVSEAIAAGVLEREGSALRVSHPLLAAAIYEACSADELRELHERLAAVVTDPEERARHLAESAEGPDEELAQALEAAAASAAARGAPDSGARLLKQALDLTPDAAEATHRRRLELARMTALAGDPKQAEQLLERQLKAAERGRQRAQIEFELGNVRLTTRGNAAAGECYERALQEVEGAAHGLELRVEILLGLAVVHQGQILDSDATDRAIALAEEAGRSDLLARALGMHALKLETPTSEFWERARAVEEAAAEVRLGGPSHAFAMHVFFSQGDFERAASELSRVIDAMRSRGDRELAWVLQDASDVARAAGAWDVAAKYAEEAYDFVVQTGLDSLEPQWLMNKARFALLRGDLDLAEEQTREALGLLDRLASIDRKLAASDGASILGRIAAMRGQLDEAHRWITEDLESIRRLDVPLARWWLAEALADDITIVVGLGDLETARLELGELVAVAEELGRQETSALAARAQGIVEAASGNVSVALRHLDRSRELLETTPTPWLFELGRTLLALGAAERRARQKHAARGTLERALGIFEQLGARLWAEKAQAELAQLGGRPVRTGALTATEKRIAELVASGHSNAEVAHELFLSPKTVEWNLSKIYRKLHVRSRTELAAKVAKRQSLVR